MRLFYKKSAKNISKTFGLEIDSIEYQEYLPGVKENRDTEKFI